MVKQKKELKVVACVAIFSDKGSNPLASTIMNTIRMRMVFLFFIYDISIIYAKTISKYIENKGKITFISSNTKDDAFQVGNSLYIRGHFDYT